jgi:copper transport protein
VRRLALAGAVLALCVPGKAWAHASLRLASPGFQERLREPPKTVRLEFDQFVTLPSIQVLDESGRNLAGPARAHGLAVVAPLSRLPKGAYTVRWQALSADSHVVSGVWTFGVRMRAPPPLEAYGAVGPTRTEHIVRWGYFVALALVIGSLGFKLLCLRGIALPARVERRLYLVTGVGVVGVIELGILAFCLRCQDVLQLPFGKFLYGDLSPISTGTRFGKAFIAMTLGFALIAALVYLAWLFERRVLLWAALATSLVFASGLSLSGHDAVDPGSSWRTQAADWVHLSAACLWAGGLLSLLVAVWPAAPELRRTAFLRFSQLATVVIALVLAAGIYLSIVRLPSFSDLWTEDYGRVLLVKVALVAVVLVWGGVHRFVVRPALAGAGDGFLVRVGRSVAGESAVGLAVLLAAAVLVDSKPPPPEPSAEVSQLARR